MFVSPAAPVMMLEYNWYGQVSEADTPIPDVNLRWCISAKHSERLVFNNNIAAYWLLILFNNVTNVDQDYPCYMIKSNLINCKFCGLLFTFP